MRKGLVLVLMLVAAVSFVGCGKKGGEKKAPVYPACETAAHCAEKGEVCVGAKCVECGTAKDCAGKGPCMSCQNNACVKNASCCANDKDCKAGEMCRVKPKQKEGTCVAK